MALVDRIFGDEVLTLSPGGNHAFSAAVWFWATGKITRAQVVAAFSFDASDDAQLDELQAFYLSLSANERRSFHSDLEAAGILAENELLTKAQYKSLFGLT